MSRFKMKLNVQKSPRQLLAERELPASRHICVSHLISPHIFETKDGALGAVISVQGCPFELKDAADLNFNQQQVAKLLLLLSDKFSIYVVTHRRRQNVYPPGEFSKGFARNFNEAYQETFINKPLFVNNQYVVFITKSRSRSKKNAFLSKAFFFIGLSDPNMRHEIDVFREKQLKQIEKIISQAMEYLSDFTPSLLGEKQGISGRQSELLEFFSLAINGARIPFSYPKQDVSTILPLYRLFLGHDTLEWQGNTEKERKIAAILSIHRYGAETASIALDNMLKVRFEYVSTHSFTPLDNRDALEKIRRQGRHLFETDDPSASQQEELALARDLVGSGYLSFGMHHNTVMVLADTKEQLDEYCAEAQKIYDLTGIKLVRESLNMESAFWSQIPGNFSYIRRGSMISSKNFADYCSFHNYHHGYMDENHLGSALMLVESSSRTPFYVNFHKRGTGNKNDFTVGHTTLIAPTGAGKTTLLLALDAQSQKYGGTRIFFDRGRGVEIYVRAMSGFYSCLTPGQSTGFNPLSLPDTPENRSFLLHWLNSLLIKKPGDLLNAREEKHVEMIINRSYDTLPFEKRNLSVIASFFPTDFKRLDHLIPWLRSPNSSRPDGRLAWIFDNESDTLNLSANMAGFDMTHLLKHESEQVVFSLMLYLFHRIEHAMDGRSLTGIYLDEAWQLLKNDYWKGKIEEYLNSARKKNTYLVFSTQLPSTVIQSPLRHTLIEGAATHLFLPNYGAEREDYMDGFKLSFREYELIKNTPAQARKFLIKQGREAAMGRLNLKGLEDYIAIFSGNDNTVKLLDAIRAEVGDDPSVWMPIFQQRRPQ
jgi:type IV secretion system protein VirB4